MIWCILFIILGFYIMMSATINLNVPFIFVGFAVFFVAFVIGLILENKKKQKNEFSKKEEIKSISPPVKKIVYKYAYNKKTHVFHRLNCSYIRGMDFNDSFCDYMKSASSYAQLIQLGYKPCKKCKPR